MQYGVPLSVARTKGSGGLGYHALFGKGHPGCQGNAVIGQLEDIVATAKGIESIWLSD